MVRVYVNAYLTDRRYGGPEEGGWWYDTGEPLASVPFDVGATGKCPVYFQGDEYNDEYSPKVGDVIGEAEEFNLWEADAADDYLLRCEMARLGNMFIEQYSKDEVEVVVEDHPASVYPEVRPHYE